AIGDVNGDGASEIAYGRGLYDQNGELLWSFGSGLYAMGSSFLAIVQLDGDPEGELVVLRSDALESRMLLFEHDGVLIKDVPISEPITGPAAFADFDGDGAHEIAVPAQTVLYLFEMDGSVAWTAPIDDWSGSSGCAGFDFDADGIAEVVYGDQDTLWILDGKSGEELHSVVRGSGTSFGTPIIVDLDADGAAEILFTSNLLARSGVHVLGQSSGRWAGTGRTWPQHDYAVTNLTADGRPGVEPAWLADNLIRVRPVADVPFPAIPDLTLVSGDHCFASCEDGPARIALGVANIGDGAVASGASLRLYSETKDGLEPVGEAFLDAVPPESQIPAAAMRVPRAHWGRPLVAQVDEGDAIIERREDNNRISIPPILCE
ncbi:MAG: VCBS repeat-containing protein, partial [Myxococcota bacterium]